MRVFPVETPWKKRQQASRERARELTRQTLQTARDALQTANEAGNTVRNLYVTFLLLSVYIGIIITGTTDKQLLSVSPITLPALSVQLPILRFYIFAPWLFLLFHFDLLVQFFLLAEKLRLFMQAISTLPVKDGAFLRKRLVNFHVMHMLTGEYDLFIKLVLASIVWITVLILPLGLLLWAQVVFLRYHDHAITWNHSIVVLADAVLLWLFWRRIVEWTSGTCLALLGVIVPIVTLSFLAALAPERNGLGTWFDNILHQNLDLHEQILIVNDVSPETLHELRSGTEQQQDQALRKILGINLQDRDLRHANFVKSILPKADFRGANLQFADLNFSQLQDANFEEARLQETSFWRAQLQGANLSETRIQKSYLREAQLQKANFWKAQLQEADLSEARLQRANFWKAQLQGANLNGAQLQGANLITAQLQGANLNGAQLQGADLSGAQLQGASLREAQLQGASLREAQLQGADLSGAQLQGADLVESSIGGANFEKAVLDYADLRNPDLSALTQEQLRSLQKDLKREIKDEETRERILKNLESIVDQPGSLQPIASSKMCLGNSPNRVASCLMETELTTYRRGQTVYLLQLACNDAAIAQGIAMNNFYWKDRHLAMALLQANCEAVKGMIEKFPDRKYLEQLANEQ